MSFHRFPLRHSPQKGVVAIIVALSMAVLIGFVGLVIDLGRLYVNKTELQSAADACALSAAAQLTCDTSVGSCAKSFLQRAEAYGIFAGGKNTRDFQNVSVKLDANKDVKFSTKLNGTYDVVDSADLKSKFAQCTARAEGIAAWFMQILGITSSTVNAQAVATLAPGQSFCNSAPIGICTKGAAPSYGYTVGEWVASDFTPGKNGDDVTLSGGFKWVDFTPNAGGTSEIRDRLAGTADVCNLKVNDEIEEPGTKWGSKDAYNTRFGIYPKGSNGKGKDNGNNTDGSVGYTLETAPPDLTGYAYPNKKPGSPVIGVGTSAFSDYQTRQGSNDPFNDKEYDSGKGSGVKGTPATSTELKNYGRSRRLVVAPFVDCSTSKTKMVGLACVLMLNPMAAGSSTIYLEYRGLANSPTSPCSSAGMPGGSTSSGPLVPTLVQ